VRTALFPGSFDPLHNGHVDVIHIASRLFDRVVVAAIRNPGKSAQLFTVEERRDMIMTACGHLGNIEVVGMKTLTVDVAKENNADVIVKGLRVATDFENELRMAQMNKAISGIETLFIPTGSTNSFIASTLVREIAKLGGVERVAGFVPPAVMAGLKEKFGS
jgi:pantetheine-phosphate adenylyltransferase